MKIFLSGLTLLTSLSALACPNLRGYYSECTTNEGHLITSEVLIEQATNSNKFKLTETPNNLDYPTVDEYVADRQEHSKVFNGEVYLNVTTCSANSWAIGTRVFKNRKMVQNYLQILKKENGVLKRSLTFYEGAKSTTVEITCR